MKISLKLFLFLTIYCMIATNMSKASETFDIKGLKFVKSQEGIDEYKLANGLKILLRQNLNSPLISWQLWYKVGSRNEKDSLTGLAHYLEHMMFKGTKEFKKGEISQAILLHGGIFNAFTSDDYTAYYENFSPENLELAIKIESDRMKNAKLDPKEIELERSVIISELEGGENNPQTLLYQSLKSNAYKVHKYRNPIIGWKDDLYNIDHESMKEFYDSYYAPNNAVAILAGNFDKKTALELIEKYFGKYKPNKVLYNKASTKEPPQKEIREVTLRYGGQSKLLALAFHIPEFSNIETPSLHILGDLLSSGSNSRLNRKLVDEGLAIKVSAYAEASLDPGIFRIIINLPLKVNEDEVLKIVLNELESLKHSENILSDELNLAKARAEASAIYDRDGIYEEALQIGYFEAISNDWTSYLSWEEKLSNVSKEDISSVTKKYFKKENMTTVKLLPEKASDSLVYLSDENFNDFMPLEQAYGAASIEPLDPKDLEKLLLKSRPKFSKEYVKKFANSKLNLGLNKIDISKIYEGSRLFLKEDHSLPIVYMNLALYAGSLKDLDEDSKTGLAYITAEMLERGTLKRDKYEIADFLDLYGAEISFNNKKESTWIEIGLLSKHKDKVLNLLREMLMEPAFDPEELEKLKNEVVAKIQLEDEYLSKVVSREFRRAIYPVAHPFRPKSTAERIESILSITVDDLKFFYKKYFSPKNLNISVVGDIKEDVLLKDLELLFKDWNINAPLSSRPSIDKVEICEPQNIEIKRENKTQSQIILGHAGFLKRTDPDFYSLLIGNYILGGNPLSSRLGKIVRDEHGYVYNVNSSFSASLGAGAFTIQLGVNPSNVDDAIKLTKKITNDFVKNGITETELLATKSYLKGSFAARNLSSNEEICDSLAQMLIYELDSTYIENYAQIIDSVTIEDVNKVIKKYIFPEKFTIVRAGP